MPQSGWSFSLSNDGCLVEQKCERVSEYGKEDNQRFNSLLAFKSGRSHNETADKAPTGTDNDKDRHEVHNPGKIIEKVGIFKTGETKAFCQDKEEEIKQDKNKESPGH